MKRFISNTIIAASVFSTAAFATPTDMVTHNLSNAFVNAYVDENPGPRPAVPNSTTKVSWRIVKIGCQNHRKTGICPAVVKIDVDSDSPIEIGTFNLNLESGEITPAQFSAHGISVTVDGPGEITIRNE